MPFLTILGVIVLLILINALYVAAEFATASSRRSRLQQMADEGSGLARMMLPIVEHPAQLDTYIAACQLGITASTLILGFYGQTAVASRAIPWLEGWSGLSPEAAASISATVILLVLTVTQVLFGELAPKNVGIRYPERMASYTVLPMLWSMALFRPLIWFFNGSGRLLLRSMGINPLAEHTHIHDPDEIRLLVRESGAGGVLGREERQLLENTLSLGEQTVRQVMVPRTRMLTAPVEMAGLDLLTLLANSPHSRLPLFSGSVDNIVGMVHLTDLLCLRLDEKGRVRPTDAPLPGVAEIMRPVFFVPEHVPVDVVFARLQKGRHQLAIVVDEYGGTAGMVALEDLVEEIFGEIEDEFDAETPLLRILTPDRIHVRGEMTVDELNKLLYLHISSDEVDTVGGLVVAKLGQLPSPGQEVQVNELLIRVEEMEGHRVALISFPARPEQVQRAQEALL